MAIAFGVSATGIYDTVDIVANTNRRDVSEVLDLWIHKRTPLLNYVKWGPDTGGTAIEWIYEHQGRGYIVGNEEITASGQTVTVATSNVGSTTEALKQISSGAMLMGWSSLNATHCIMLVTDVSTTGEFLIDIIEPASDQTIDALTKLYILGNWANEASVPKNYDMTRARTILTNNMGILRQDIGISGSMLATDMYAVSDEFRHQLETRLLHMQREREMAAFFSMGANTTAGGVTRTAATASQYRGIYSFLVGESGGTHIDETTTTLTEGKLNDVVEELWNTGCNCNAIFASTARTRQITDWSKHRVRSAPETKLGGMHITKYLTDVGEELAVHAVPDFPPQFLFVLDTSKLQFRAKKGRKLLVEKLGRSGDYTQWQCLSEHSLEAKGAMIGKLGGLFNKLGTT